MDYRELLEKFNLLLKENSGLIRENDRLKEQLGITNHKPPEMRLVEPTTKKSTPIDGRPDRTSFPEASAILLYRGTEKLMVDGILCCPVDDFLLQLKPNHWLNGVNNVKIRT